MTTQDNVSAPMNIGYSLNMGDHKKTINGLKGRLLRGYLKESIQQDAKDLSQKIEDGMRETSIFLQESYHKINTLAVDTVKKHWLPLTAVTVLTLIGGYQALNKIEVANGLDLPSNFESPYSNTK